MKKQPEVTAQTKQALMDAFWELYCEHSFEKITVKWITEKAGYNRGTFYVYFKNVQDVLIQIEDSLLPTDEQYQEILEMKLESIDSEMISEQFYRMYELHGDKLRVLLGPNGDLNFAHRIKNIFKDELIQHLGHLSDKDRLKWEYAMEYEFSARLGMMTLWFNNNKDMGIDEFAALFYELSSNGVIPTLQTIIDPENSGNGRS
ncbi:MAG TPA: TetR/AcrR family transcriptional regulator [Planococcus sp. (in: firmicutes)]|nr:TetR/AcrR family transcriptional regulator [Planococcus sp. (in: firmicutes)]